MKILQGFVKKDLPSKLRRIEKVYPTYYDSSASTSQYFPVLMGDQSDLSMGEPRICKTVEKWNKENREISFKISTIDEFFKEIESLVSSSKNKLHTFKGEAPYEFYSIPALCTQTYKICREAENRLLSAEKLSLLKKVLNLRKTFPHKRIESAWENLTLPQDHNIGGMHGEINERNRLNKARETLDIASSLNEEATYSIASHIAYKEEGIPVVVFNPLSWEREEILRANVILEGKNVEAVSITDLNGEKVVSQVIEKKTISFSTKLEFIFLARVPPLGYRTYYVYAGGKEEFKPTLCISKKEVYENEFFKVVFSSQGIKSIKHKRKELVLKNKYNWGQVIVLEDTGDDVNESFTNKKWKAIYDLSTLKIVENGPLRARLQWEGKVLDSKIIQEVVFYGQIARLDFSTTLDWEGRRSTQVRLAYPLDICRAKITYEIPYGSILYPDEEMPYTYRGTGGRYVQKWIDISNENYGITMATQNCSHSFSSPSTIYPILIRTTFSSSDSFFWYHNRGKHTFLHSFLPHRGDWKEEHTYRFGWEYNNPLIVDEVRTCAFQGPTHRCSPEEEGILPQEFSLLSVEEPNIVITVAKEAYDKKGWIIRLFEVEGKEGIVNLTFNRGLSIKEAWETNLLEEKTGEVKHEGREIKVRVSSYGIHTIKLRVSNFEDVREQVKVWV